MPIIRTCEYCDYTSTEKNNYDRHLKSNKHLKNLKIYKERPNNKLSCEYCQTSYSSMASLNRHMLSCKIAISCQIKKEYEAKLKEKDYEILLLKKDLSNAHKIIEIKEDTRKQTMELSKKTIEILDDENNFHKQLVTDANAVVKSSMNALKFVKTNYPNAPPLIEYSNMGILQFEKEYSVAEIMIFHSENNTMAKRIGDVILEEYKKPDPTKQSFWNTDLARLGYVIVAGEGDEKQWTVDKGGVKVQELLVDPLLYHIRQKLNSYSFDNAKLMGKNPRRHEIYTDKICRSNTVIKKIDNGSVCKKVVVYLAKHVNIANNLSIK